jgi:magnesium-transporting ATPase (P-type)
VISKKITSKTGDVSVNCVTQKDLIHEFMKILGLAHMCAVEEFTNENGEKERFYNGESPDEVALVEFAAHMDFSCLSSKEDKIVM